MANTKSSRRRPASSASAAGAKPRGNRRGQSQSRRRSRSSSSSNAELDALYDTFLQQPAQLTLEQMNLIERRLCTGDTQWRQLALASLTKSGAELKQRFAATREAAQLAAELLTVADDMGKRLHQLAGMLETASTRLMLSLCERPDMHELIATAQARMHSGAAPADAASADAVAPEAMAEEAACGCATGAPERSAES
jgi:hypothetical protein